MDACDLLDSIMHAPQHSRRATHAQVATYHYDIKRMDDRLQTGGLQVCGWFADCSASGAGPQGLDAAYVCWQVTSSTGTLSLDVAPASKVVAAVQAYKVFLVQVRVGRERVGRPALQRRGAAQPSLRRVPPRFLLWRPFAQELCTCPLRTVLQQGALHLNPNKLVRRCALRSLPAT